ncbi:MAG: ABC transporter substrate-binding protein [Oscillospiraceae bacterium]|nr:ABC transporter substrate-binding protein [Oscillospiraceae bacterium]
MKKLLALILAVMMTVSMLAACGSSAGNQASEPASEPASTAEESSAEESSVEEVPYEGITIRLGGLKGPTSMGMVKLLDDAENGLTANTYEFTMAGSADELTPKFMKGEIDILAVPANLGAVLEANTGGGVKMIAVNTLGVIYVVEKGGETIQSIEDLKGKTVYSTGKGSTPEYAFTYLLAQHGLELGTDVTVEWKSEPTEVVAQMSAEESSIALLPQPFVTVAGTQIEGLRVALDLTEEWNKLGNGSQFVTAGLIARTDFVEQNPEAVAKFLEEYAASTAYVNENVSDAAQLVEKYDIVKAQIAEKAIPHCNIVCVTGAEMKAMLQGYFQVLFDQNPAAVGGILPEDGFYWGA